MADYEESYNLYQQLSWAYYGKLLTLTIKKYIKIQIRVILTSMELPHSITNVQYNVTYQRFFFDHQHCRGPVKWRGVIIPIFIQFCQILQELLHRNENFISDLGK